MLRGYTVKLYPDQSQRELLMRYFGCCRWVYNKMIEINQKRYHRTGKGMSGYDMQNMLPPLKRQYPWLAEVGSQALQITCHNLADAYNGFFKGRTQYPRYRRKGRKESFTCINNSRLEGDQIRLPKLGLVHYRGGDQPAGKPKRFTVREKAGKFYCSILFESPEEPPPTAIPDPILGIDLGLADVVVTSRGDVFPSPRHLKQIRGKLKTAQQHLSRCQPGSNRRRRARMQVAVIHEKVANQRKDFNHKLSRILIDSGDSQALAVEDLNIKGMLSNHKLAFHIADSGWGQFLMFLRYKATAVGKQVITVDRFYPSSKTCSVCGLVRESLPLNVRHWTCSCGAEHHRDINAAINIAYEAARNVVSERGGGVSPAVALAPACET